MAIPTNIKTLLSGEVVEWARIEFKETWDPAASLKTVCAFANDLDNWGGGYIVIGVEEEDGRPVYPLKGVPAEKLDKYQKEIFAKCKLIRPAYMPIIGVETYQNKHFIVIWCPGGETRPYSSPKQWKRIIRSVFTIFVSLLILWNQLMMRRRICLTLQIGFRLMIE